MMVEAGHVPGPCNKIYWSPLWTQVKGKLFSSDECVTAALVLDRQLRQHSNTSSAASEPGL